MEQFYAENVIFMPDTYQPINDKLVVSSCIPSKEECGLPQSSFVFCAINQGYKIKPEEFGIWMRLLKKVGGSVLWLKSQNEGMEFNLKKEAVKRGVDPSRLIFAHQVSHDQYLAQFKQADLYLDTFNYNAGTTASDLLMAGLPIITKMGRSYASRMASSLLNACDMNDLITETSADYERLSLELATDPDKLDEVRKRLINNTKNTSIFDTKLYTRNLEAAFHKAYNIYYSGYTAQNIEIYGDSPSHNESNFS
jgi:predicted O-linked N-acetylglucosamine transferase (SPINDLY family)